MANSRPCRCDITLPQTRHGAQPQRKEEYSKPEIRMEDLLITCLGTHSAFDSPQRSAFAADQKPASQTLQFSQIPGAGNASQSAYRAPSFTTPRKPVEIDFSSGAENISSPDQADTEDTPEAAKSATVYFTANQGKPANKRNSLFNFYGRFAPPRPDTSKSSQNHALIRRVHKRRRREQNLGRQLALARRSSTDTSDEEPSTQEGKNPIPPVHEVGYMAGLFTFIESFPNAPSLLAKYLQLFFNSAIILGCLYMIYSFWTTIQDDVNRASEDAAAEALAEMAACAKSYVDNRCAGNSRLPALETVCSNWELCMNRDPNAVKRAKLSAHTFAEILNSFVEPISLKTMVSRMTFALPLHAIIIFNIHLFCAYRSKNHSYFPSCFTFSVIWQKPKNNQQSVFAGGHPPNY
jgi:Di-sulfide bridge nucleocytoplasmic transport domain